MNIKRYFFFFLKKIVVQNYELGCTEGKKKNFFKNCKIELCPGNGKYETFLN